MSKKEKIQWMLIGAIVIATALFLWVRESGTEGTERIWIARPENETKKQSIAMVLEEKQEEWTLEVAPRRRTEEEIDTAFSESIRILNAAFGIGDDGKVVWTDSIALPQRIEETGVEIRWNSTAPEVLSKDGVIQREHLKETCGVNLQARLSFAEEEREHWFAIEVPPYEEGSREALLYGAKKELQSLEEETAGEDGFYLPEEIGAVSVGLPEEADTTWAVIVIAVLFLPFALFFTKHQEKEKEKKRRADELLAAYPQVITKLTLYTGAGLSLRGAWERLAAEYRTKAEKTGKQNAISEEIFILAGELKNGTSEARAYEAFGRRIALKPYMRCASLLVSQLQKGSGGLRKSLEGEVQLAWEMHRERAAKKGEEAQTKLLFPMMGMLFLVMAVVMIPAFFSM